jgi:hypothetical protein
MIEDYVMIRIPFPLGSARRAERYVSRRRFLHAAAGTLGALGAGLLCPTRVRAAGRDPMPIPAVFNFPGPADAVSDGTPVHPGNDPASINDFDGYIGVAAMQGTGTGTNTQTGDTTPLLFDSDLRFMQGVYRSMDGRFIETSLVLV